MSLPRFAPLAAAVTLTFVLGAPAARGDVAPPNSCNTAGQSCNTALGPGGQYTAAGTCVQTMCPHTGPQPDGSIGTTEIPCALCEPSDAGTSGSGGGGKSGGGGGCSIGRFSALDFAPLGLVAAGAALLAASRRRRGTRS